MAGVDPEVVSEWLDGKDIGERWTVREELGFEADFGFDDPEFPSVVDGVVGNAPPELLPAGTMIWFVTDSNCSIDGALVTRDIDAVRYCSECLDMRDLTIDRGAKGDAQIVTILQAISEVAIRISQKAVASSG